ncbi:hypothetical protein D9M69_565930 [compost metagenome]
MPHEIEALRKGDEVRLVLQVEAVVDPHLLDEARLRAVRRLAAQHRNEAGLHHADVGLEDGHAPLGAPRLVGKALALGAACHRLLDHHRAPQVRHELGGRAEGAREVRLAGGFVLGQRPHLVVGRAADQHAVRLVEGHALDVDHVVVAHAHRDDFSAALAERHRPVAPQLRAHLDHEVEFVRGGGHVDDRHRRVGQEVGGVGRTAVAAAGHQHRALDAG